MNKSWNFCFFTFTNDRKTWSKHGIWKSTKQKWRFRTVYTLLRQKRNKGGHDQNHATIYWKIIHGLIKNEFNIIHRCSQQNFKCTFPIISGLFSQKIFLTFFACQPEIFFQLECWWAKWVTAVSTQEPNMHGVCHCMGIIHTLLYFLLILTMHSQQILLNIHQTLCNKWMIPYK